MWYSGDRRLDPFMAVGDDQLSATQPAARELAQKVGPERRGFQRIDIQSKHPPAAVSKATRPAGHQGPPLQRENCLAGRRVSWAANPSCASTLTAPVLPPSKSREASRSPVANS